MAAKKKLSKNQTLTLITSYPLDVKWTAIHSRCANINGNAGWRSVFCANGLPVFSMEIDNAHTCCRVSDARGTDPYEYGSND